LAIKVLTKDLDTDAVGAHLEQNVQGEVVSFTNEHLASFRDDARIRKLYRIDAPKKGESTVLGVEAEAFVLGSMALKGS
jgi:EKC/KEOPS complex subunit CGI121/TPRKB